MDWKRYAIYWLPDGAFGRAGAGWLGWDARAGQAVAGAAPDTEIPRRYGFHATIKPPFRLTDGAAGADLAKAARALASRQDPVAIGRLRVTRVGRFAALVPEVEPARLAAAMVAELDMFRAPASAAELAKRRASGLSGAQEALLRRWGYPYVMEAFRMHLTLTGPDPAAETVARARAVFAGIAMPRRIEALSLVGEDAEGRFHLIDDLPLGGARDAGSGRD